MSEQFENIIEIDEEELVEYIHEKMGANIEKAVIGAVLQLEFDYLKAKGVIESE